MNETMSRIDIASENNSLWSWSKPITALYAWKEAKGLEEMQTWLKTQLSNKDVLLRLAAIRTGFGDALTIENRELLPDEFIGAVYKLLEQTPSDLTTEERNKLIFFKSAWEQTQTS
ncbi:hypothetical protein [Deefgea salmonis]|uniref:Uncharacterized protein n=1 Tax=Deefgea salmonis TaxID=2875502 RepID=A0ABS8BMC7_9NEIS|nr:hypothetical protein [Deefgea salmonis]MCB5196879.1 hypothetical protein [Deefgea salmonis]